MKKSSFLARIARRVTKHWVSSLTGGLVIFFSYLVYSRHINTTEWVTVVGAILGFYFTFFKKDDSKVISKPENYSEMKSSAYNEKPLKERIE